MIPFCMVQRARTRLLVVGPALVSGGVISHLYGGVILCLYGGVILCLYGGVILCLYGGGRDDRRRLRS